MRVWVIIYTWRGERHSPGQSWPTISAARKHLRAYHADGWNAWIEERYTDRKAA